MSEIVAPGGPLPDVPSNLTIPQFLLDIDWHPTRPPLLSRILNPCMIEDATGRAISFEEVSARKKASPLVRLVMASIGPHTYSGAGECFTFPLRHRCTFGSIMSI